MKRIFSTFCHINDYEQAGYASLHRMIVSSFPLVLWAPSGRLLETYYQQGICRISLKQMLAYVEKGFVHIICRGEWLDKRFRQSHPWEGARWLDGFDDVIKGIYEERKNTPEHECSVQVVEKEDGPAWAEEFLSKKPEIIDRVKNLIEANRVPQGSQEKALRVLEKKGEYEATLIVLRDLRNHIRAKELAEARVPFFSPKDGAFFRLLEEDGRVRASSTMSLLKRDIVVHPKLGQEIERLLERLKYPEKILAFDSFIGSSVHEELAEWFSAATDAVESVLPQDIEKLLEERLREYIEAGRLQENLANTLSLETSSLKSGATANRLITRVASLALDPTNTLDMHGLDVNVVPIVSGVSRQIGMVGADYERPQWSFLSSFGKAERRKENTGELGDTNQDSPRR